MAFRSFNDAQGREWQVFDVIPRSSDRRESERRSIAPQADPEEERREADRRLTVGAATVSSATLRRGWLVFESGADQRRLSPIPENWQRATDGELEAYRETARPVQPKKERRG
ncbi:MAG TPA: hypothetical protein VGM67_01840 [Gemmatimonadaceae bacterium]